MFSSFMEKLRIEGLVTWVPMIFAIVFGAAFLILIAVMVRRRFLLKRIWKNALGGDAESQFVLGMRYIDSMPSVRNRQNGISWVTRSAENGYGEAGYKLGLFYMYGDVVEEDHKKAAAWFEKAAANGVSEAALSLGTLYGLDSSPVHDYVKSAVWLRKAALSGYPTAAFMLALMYKDGIGVQKSNSEAAAWFIVSSEIGDENMVLDADEFLSEISESELKEGEKLAHSLRSAS